MASKPTNYRDGKRVCAICDETITYPDGCNLRGGRMVHAACLQANRVGVKVRIPRQAVR